jgi:hypothetical protein
LAFAFDNRGEEGHGLGTGALVPRGEEGADPVMTGVGKPETEACAFMREELVWDLDEDPRPVAGVLLGAGRPTVGKMLYGGDSVIHELMGLVALEVCDETDAATVMLVAGII